MKGKQSDANCRLQSLNKDSVDTKRMSAFLLNSLPKHSAQSKLERLPCLDMLNLLHSVSIWPHSSTLGDRSVNDFAETIFSLSIRIQQERDFVT